MLCACARPAVSPLCVCEAQDQLSLRCVCVYACMCVSARGLTSPVCHSLLVAVSRISLVTSPGPSSGQSLSEPSPLPSPWRCTVVGQRSPFACPLMSRLPAALAQSPGWPAVCRAVPSAPPSSAAPGSPTVPTGTGPVRGRGKGGTL